MITFSLLSFYKVRKLSPNQQNQIHLSYHRR